MTKGDYLYCEHCNSVHIDVYEIHETRTDTKFLPSCPHCGAWKSINISVILEKKESTGAWASARHFYLKAIEDHKRTVKLRGKPKVERTRRTGY